MRLYWGEDASVFGSEIRPDGTVVLDVMTNDDGTDNYWMNPRYDNQIVCNWREIEIRVKTRYPHLHPVWSLFDILDDDEKQFVKI